jgi:hypothetical protein
VEQADVQRIQRELQEVAERSFPGAVGRVAVLQHGDDPIVEPGEVMLRIVASESASRAEAPADAFGAPAMKQFQSELSARLPEVRRIEILSEDTDGKRRGRLIRIGPRDEKPDSDLTPVMVRMRAAELEIVDTLISVGIAANRAEAVRWALARISERPVYGQLRERTLEIERLKSEF